jgi:cbb3-type cytochrome oxidase subunit 1
MPHISKWFFRLASLYLIAGIALGLVMAASHDFSAVPAHAHLNLLGWVTMSIFAVFYRLWPAAAASKLAKVHFWIYVPAHFLQMVTLFMFVRGNTAVEPVLAIVSFAVAIAVLVFVVNLWKHTASAASTAQPVGTAAA